MCNCNLGAHKTVLLEYLVKTNQIVTCVKKKKSSIWLYDLEKICTKNTKMVMKLYLLINSIHPSILLCASNSRSQGGWSLSQLA